MISFSPEAFELLTAERDKLKAQNAKMRKALEDVLKCALHPDRAIRATFVPLQPIRNLLKELDGQ